MIRAGGQLFKQMLIALFQQQRALSRPSRTCTSGQSQIYERLCFFFHTAVPDWNLAIAISLSFHPILFLYAKGVVGLCSRALFFFSLYLKSCTLCFFPRIFFQVSSA